MLQAHVEYETANRHYAHVDCPGHADYVKVRLRRFLEVAAFSSLPEIVSVKAELLSAFSRGCMRPILDYILCRI